ncbi:MAG: toxin TcdB middle/C-terminal domain-containing protein [Myxococcota bacterium]
MCRGRRTNQHGVYLRVPAETRTANYERSDGDPRVGHEIVLETDAYGRVVRSAMVAYPRRTEQQELHIVVTERTLFHVDRDQMHLNVVFEGRSWELTRHDLVRADTAPFTVLEMRQDLWDQAQPRDFESPPKTTPESGGGFRVEKRRFAETRVLYFADDHVSAYDGSTAFPAKRIVYETYQLAFPDSFLTNGPLAGRTTATDLGDAGYVQLTGPDWWRPSGRPTLDASATSFFQPRAITDPFGA